MQKTRKDVEQMQDKQLNQQTGARDVMATSLELPEFLDKHEERLKGFTVRRGNELEILTLKRMYRTIVWACQGFEEDVDVHLILEEALKNFFDNIAHHEIAEALVLAAVGLIERDPAYGYVAARLLRKKLFKETTDRSIITSDIEQLYRQSFISSIHRGIQEQLYDKRLAEFDLERLSQELVISRDDLLDYMGLRTLYERYFTKIGNNHTELPQVFWMRVSMGLCYNESDKNAAAAQFYHVISPLHYVPSTPTLLHAGLKRPQLSSCYLTTVEDDLHHIFKCIGDNAQLSKWSGGLANDWSNIRAIGAQIKSINTESQGLIPFLKIANDTTAAINRSGKRRSAAVVYLEVWHLEIEDFLDLRRNTGDERRRTHDINTACWVPDLFMKRVIENGNWTLFSPHEVPDLHHIYGKKFEDRYMHYEQMAAEGKLEMSRTIPASQLWRKMITRLFETGHPWLTFKDPSNIRSPQDHAGVVHSSNLCTEITLNTSADETAVCNLGSVNLSEHVINGAIDWNRLEQTVRHAIRMLDNVIDINFYPTKEAEQSNVRHRPIGLGLMGFQDMLYKLNISFDDQRARTFADEIMEFISYHAIKTSAELARERGPYSSYRGSKWDRGIFPLDTLDLLEQERGMPVAIDRITRLDWASLKSLVKLYGMRNSNTMAIAPTATISTIAGCFPCIEPIYKNIYVKANMTGEFTVVNKYVIKDLKALNLWDQAMLDQIKYYDGNIQLIERIPEHIKDKYKEVFEIDPLWLVEITASRAKWIDQSQSHNVFMRGTSGKLLSDIYIAGWNKGMKTYYYTRTLGASQIEKSTLDSQQFGFTQKRVYKPLNSATESSNSTTANDQNIQEEQSMEGRACSISTDPDCEVCQ